MFNELYVNMARLAFSNPPTYIPYKAEDDVLLEHSEKGWRYFLSGEEVFAFDSKQNLLSLYLPRCATPAEMGRHNLSVAIRNKDIVREVWKEAVQCYFKDSLRDILPFIIVYSGCLTLTAPTDFVREFYSRVESSKAYPFTGDNLLLRVEAKFYPPLSFRDYVPVTTLEERIKPHISMYGSDRRMRLIMWSSILKEICALEFFGKEIDDDEIVEMVNLLLVDLRLSGTL